MQDILRNETMFNRKSWNTTTYDTVGKDIYANTNANTNADAIVNTMTLFSFASNDRFLSTCPVHAAI